MNGPRRPLMVNPRALFVGERGDVEGLGPYLPQRDPAGVQPGGFDPAQLAEMAARPRGGQIAPNPMRRLPDQGPPGVLFPDINGRPRDFVFTNDDQGYGDNGTNGDQIRRALAEQIVAREAPQRRVLSPAPTLTRGRY